MQSMTNRPSMRKMKYIVIENYWAGISTSTMIFPFHVCIEHKVFADALIAAQPISRGVKVISAGFCYSGDELNRPSCHGESVSLGLKSRPEQDTQLLRSLMEDGY